MSPPASEIDDFPAEVLTGYVDLSVVLPSGRKNKMRVKRSTPMMDLLVQIATANKLSPGSHVINATNLNEVLPYKPSTPIGALGSCIINIVPKSQISSSNAQKSVLKLVNTPFEQTFRLQVFLPRNQLYVTRISPKTKIADILFQVCSEKNLDPSKYSIRHPNNVGEILDVNLCLADYQLQQVTLVSNQCRSVSMSNIQEISLLHSDDQVNYKIRPLNSNFKSENLAADGIKSLPASVVIPARPVKKRRPAPKPPQNPNQNISHRESYVRESEATVISHSRNSSDSSGYHETSILGESPDVDYCFPDPLSCRNKLSDSSEVSTYQTLPNLSRSLSNLTTVDNNPNANQRIHHSVSTTCLPSCTRRKKKAPSPPPRFALKANVINEETSSSSCSRPETESISSLCTSSLLSDCEPSTSTLDIKSVSEDCLNRVNAHETKASTLPANTKLPDVQCISQTPEETIASVSNEDADSDSQPKLSTNNGIESKSSDLSDALNSEVKMNDEEIDRIFNNATYGHETSSFRSLESPVSSIALSEEESNTDGNQKSSISGDLKHDNSCTEEHSFESDMLVKNEAETEQNPVEQSVASNKSQPKEIVRDFSTLEPNFSNLNSDSQSNDSGLDLREDSMPSNSSSLKNEFKFKTPSSEISESISVFKHPNNLVRSKTKSTSSVNLSTIASVESNAADKFPVINELKTVINERSSVKPSAKSKFSSPFKQPELKRSASVLDNFKISAYQTIKKPIHVLTDSLESSSFNDPYKESSVKKPLSVVYGQNNFNREKQNAKSIKRSTSHVSLSTIEKCYDQSFKSNLPTFKNLKSKVVSNGNLAASNENLLKFCYPNGLRKINSEINLNEDKFSNHMNPWKNVPLKKFSVDSEDSGLQSLQVMKTILPHLNRSCSNLKEDELESEQTEFDKLEEVKSKLKVFRGESYSAVKSVSSMEKSERLSTPQFKLDQSPPTSIELIRRGWQDSRSAVRDGTLSSSDFKQVPEKVSEISSVHEKSVDSCSTSRIPSIKSMELKSLYSSMQKPIKVPEPVLYQVQKPSYSSSKTSPNLIKNTSPKLNSVEISEIKTFPMKNYICDQSLKKENSSFSENYLKNSLKSTYRDYLNDDKNQSCKPKEITSKPKSLFEKNFDGISYAGSPLKSSRHYDAGTGQKKVDTPSPVLFMHKLKPVSKREIKNPKFEKVIDPKDLLLDSIRSFGGIANLKKTNVT